MAKGPTTENRRIFRFTRIAFGVIASPFILGATINFHLKKYDTVLAHEIQQSLYVDNVFIDADSVPEAEEKYRKSKKMFLKNYLTEGITNWPNNIQVSKNMAQPNDDSNNF